MRKITKRVFTVLLTLVMLSTALPLGVFAMEKQSDTETFAETEVSGTNSAGNILAEVITEAQEDAEEKAAASAGISAMALNGFTADVEFFTDRDAKLVVAIYTEDGKQMLTSGVSDVTAEDTTATVQINSITLPQYYLVKAFLLDAATNASLCGFFTDDTHTSAYKDFMALDTNDFDEDKVINLDASEDNNFLVIADEAESINGTASVNVFASADYEASKYVFENIDSAISSLKIGDIFYYTSTDGKYEIIKVKSISISGSTATIVSDTMEMEEAFEVIKIDTSKSEYAVQQNNNGDYFGTSAVEYNKNVTILKGEFEVKLGKDDKGKIKPQITKKEIQTGVAENDKIDEEDKSLEFVAKLNAKAELSAKLVVYVATFYKKVEFTLNGEAGITIDIGIEFDKTFDIGKFNFNLYALVNIGVKFGFKVEAKLVLEISGTLTFKSGFKAVDGEFEKISEKPTFSVPDNSEVKLKGELFIGLVLTPYVNIINDRVMDITFPINVGPRITAELSSNVAMDENHDCNACVSGEVNVEIKGSPKVEIAKTGWSWIKRTWEWENLIDVTIHITKFYYSITHADFGFGICPYNKGNLIKFGSYPQSKVTDSATLSALNAKSLSWKSYGYYSGTGSYGTMTASDYMKYADVTYNGDRYRAVKFTKYRPTYTYYSNNDSSTSTNQGDNGYTTNTIYWFKYEPIEWQVLDQNNGLIMSKTLIDVQSYNNTIYEYGIAPTHNGKLSAYWSDPTHTIYANDYETSSIRIWLNDDFYNTAFTSNQKSKIKITTLDNSTYDSNYSEYDSATTKDKVFLLSYNEIKNDSYGFNISASNEDYARFAKGSDYAKCQGLYVFDATSYQWEKVYHGNSPWILRNPGTFSSSRMAVTYTGKVGAQSPVVETNNGIRPAMRISNLSDLLTASSANSEYLGMETLETQSTETTEVIAGTETSFTVNTCLADGRYTLLNVTGYGEDFELTADNLLYIDVLTADSYGNLTVDFTPMRNDETATTLLIGDFGNGIEAKDPGNVTASITGVTYEQSKDTHNTFSVTVDGRPAMIQFIEPDGGTRTYDRNNKNVTIKSYDSDGNEVNSLDRNLAYEVWLIYSNMSTGVQIKTRAKYLNGAIYSWDKVTYNFKVELLPSDGAVRSVIPAATSGRFGAVETIVVTGPDAEAIRFKMEDGSTSTYYASKATVLNNGDLSFTGKAWMNFVGINTVEVYVKVDGKWQYATEFDYEANDYPITA